MTWWSFWQFSVVALLAVIAFQLWGLWDLLHIVLDTRRDLEAVRGDLHDIQNEIRSGMDDLQNEIRSGVDDIHHEPYYGGRDDFNDGDGHYDMPINILMPALSPTMKKGNLTKWLKKEGEAVNTGDVIAEIATGKATMECEAVDDGILAKIVVPEGTNDVLVNQVIAVLQPANRVR